MDAFLTSSSDARVRPPAAARTAVAMLFFMNGALFASWAARIPAIRTELDLSHATLGLVLLAAALGALIAMPVAGGCVSRFGSRQVSQITAISFGAILPSLALAPNAALLALSLLFLGAGNGALDVAMNAQAVAVEKCYGRPILSSFHGLWSLGALSGAGLGGLAAAAQITPLTHFCAAAALLGGATAVFALPRLIEAGDAHTPPALDGDEARRTFVWPSRTLLALGTLAFCIMLGEGAMADWSAIFLREICRVGEGWAAAGYAAFALAMAAARFSGDSLSARFGPVAVVRAGSAVAAGGLAVSLLIPHPVIVLAGFAAVGAGLATIIPQVFSAAGRTPGIAPGPALATATTLGYSGFLIGPPLIGFAAEHIGLRGALSLAVFTSAAAITLAPSVGPIAAADR